MTKLVKTLVRRLSATLIPALAVLWVLTALPQTALAPRVYAAALPSEPAAAEPEQAAAAAAAATDPSYIAVQGPGDSQAQPTGPGTEAARDAASEPAAEPEPESEPEPDFEAEPEAQAALSDPGGTAQDDQQTVYAPQAGAEATLSIMVCCLDQAGARISQADFSIYTPDGPITARSGLRGTAVLGPLAPGSYTLTHPGGTAVFTLLENGTVDCQNPLCCGDGEYLTFSAAPRCRLTLTCRAPSAQGYWWFTITTADGQTLDRTVSFSPDLPPRADGSYETTLLLTALEPGETTIARTDAAGQVLTTRLTLNAGQEAVLTFG